MLYVRQTMGMPIQIDVRDEGHGEVPVERVFEWLDWVDQTFSTYRAGSIISSLNAGHDLDAARHPEVKEVLRACEGLRNETEGYFDIQTSRLPVPIKLDSGETTTKGIDPSGYVKGWAVMRAGAILDEAGLRDYNINAGGDILLRGAPLPDRVWRIGIRHPFERDKVAAVVEANDLAIATSATYERGEHIVDPHSGLPPKGVLSVTIVGPDLGFADAYATAAFAMGDEGPRWTLGLAEYEAMTILPEETVLFTPGFPNVA